MIDTGQPPWCTRMVVRPINSVSSALGAPIDWPGIIRKRIGGAMTRTYQTRCLVFSHQTHRPRNLDEEAFDTEYQGRDQGGESLRLSNLFGWWGGGMAKTNLNQHSSLSIIG